MAPLRGLVEQNQSAYDRYGWALSGNWGDSMVTAFYPPNPQRNVASGAALYYTASSLHPGGLNALLGDGSVRFVRESIASRPFDSATGQPQGITTTAGDAYANVPPPRAWQALATRNGGESIPADEF